MPGKTVKSANNKSIKSDIIRQKFDVSTLAIIATILFVITLIPILAAGHYARPSADDFSFGYDVHQVVKSGEATLFDVLNGAVKKTLKTYKDWQGCFSASYFNALQPATISADLYFLTTYIMIFSLCFSTYMLMNTIFCKWLHLRNPYAVLLSVIVLLLQIQFVPDKNEAFFWFNGSCAYTVFYSLSLLLYSFSIRLLISKRTNNIGLVVCSSILAFVIGGGNYTTALATSVVMVTLSVILFVKKTKKRSNIAIITLFLLVGFIISAIAPGNKVRASLTHSSYSPFEAVFWSLFYGIWFFFEHFLTPQVICIAYISPIVVWAASKCSWSFKHPIIVCIYAMCIYCCQFTPPLYAMQSIGSGRQIDIYYYAMYLTALFILFYISGYFTHSYPKLIDVLNLRLFCKSKLLIASVIFCVLFILSVCPTGGGLPGMTTVMTTKSFVDGTIEEYDKEYTEIEKKLESDCDECVIKEIETCPKFLSKLNIVENETDDNYWINKAIAKYYGHRAVVLDTTTDKMQ